MSEHLDKAKAALADAAAMDVSVDEEHPPMAYLRLLNIADVQAGVATAAALERVADVLEESLPL